MEEYMIEEVQKKKQRETRSEENKWILQESENK
jgi:hypothetical protein